MGAAPNCEANLTRYGTHLVNVRALAACPLGRGFTFVRILWRLVIGVMELLTTLGAMIIICVVGNATVLTLPITKGRVWLLLYLLFRDLCRQATRRRDFSGHPIIRWEQYLENGTTSLVFAPSAFKAPHRVEFVAVFAGPHFFNFSIDG